MSNDDRDSDAYMDVDSSAVNTTDDAKTMTTVTPTALAATIRPRPQYCLPPCILHFQRREHNPVTRLALRSVVIINRHFSTLRRYSRLRHWIPR